MDDFLPASATDAKSRKASLKQAKTVSSSSKGKKGKAVAKGSRTLLPTQPATSAGVGAGVVNGDDDDDMGFERLPLYDVNAVVNRTTTLDAGAAASAMMDTSGTSDDEQDDDAILIDPSSLSLPEPVSRIPISQIPGSNALSFPAVSHTSTSGLTQRRKVGIPQHRMTPLKRDWVSIYGPLVEECGLQVRMNLGKRWVELKTSKHTPAANSLSRATDFLSAYALGFSAEDAIALLRLEELYIESFEIKDVKTLHGDHLSRAIGRIAGHEGKTRFVIENASRTRIVLADTKIHVLGTYTNIKIARDAICALILGSPPGKIYAGLRQVASRSRERF